jgi:hypothetical protein
MTNPTRQPSLLDGRTSVCLTGAAGTRPRQAADEAIGKRLYGAAHEKPSAPEQTVRRKPWLGVARQAHVLSGRRRTILEPTSRAQTPHLAT